MKKAAVEQFLRHLEQTARRSGGPRTQKQLEAIRECRQWLELSEAEILRNIKERLEELNAHMQSLPEKQKTEWEREQFLLLHDESVIYTSFEIKILS